MLKEPLNSGLPLAEHVVHVAKAEADYNQSKLTLGQ